MNQNDFNRAVAQATGESVETIAHRGFVLLTPTPYEREPRRTNYEKFLGAFLASARRRPRNRAAA